MWDNLQSAEREVLGPMTWHLDPRNVGRPEPRFRGQVYQSQIKLAQFTAGSGRDSSSAQLDVRPEPAADGGTVLSGRIGLPDALLVVLLMFTVAVGLVSLGLLVAGVAQLVTGASSGWRLPWHFRCPWSQP
jgi:hypothetical protein